MTVWELLIKTFKEGPQQNIKLSMGLFKYGPCVTAQVADDISLIVRLVDNPEKTTRM